MNTKLTLNLEKSIIEQAKSYAKSHHVSLSKIIENYLESLTAHTKNTTKISPLVESLTGVIPNNNTNEKDDYGNYLSEKYS